MMSILKAKPTCKNLWAMNVEQNHSNYSQNNNRTDDVSSDQLTVPLACLYPWSLLEMHSGHHCSLECKTFLLPTMKLLSLVRYLQHVTTLLLLGSYKHLLKHNTDKIKTHRHTSLDVFFAFCLHKLQCSQNALRRMGSKHMQHTTILTATFVLY